MRIGELATQSGVSVRSLRYYEQQGLISSVRSAGGHRHYTENEVSRVALIRALFGGGLSSSTIGQLLPYVDSPSAENCEAAIARMREEREKLSAHIADLVRTGEALDQLIDTALANGRATACAARSRGSRRPVP
jgi:DNA-binding transcriptional MerR regulator